MKESKLITLLKSLKTKELRELKDYVESPFFNKQEEIVCLYQFLFNQAPYFSPQKIAKEKIFSVVFPSLPFNSKQLSYVFSDLLKLAENYLVYKQLQNDKDQTDYYGLKALLDKNLEKHYSAKFRKVVEKLGKEDQHSMTYYRTNYLVFDVENQRYLKSNVRIKDNNLQKAADNFDTYFLIQKIKYSCEMLNRNNVLKSDFKIGLYNEIKKHLATTDYNSIPLLQAYVFVFFILIQENDRHYFLELKKILKDKLLNIERKQLEDFFGHAINYCAMQIRKGDRKFLEELLEIYVLGFERKVLLDNGFISPWNFKNVIRIGLNLKRYDWTENFILNYSDNLQSKFRDSALNYNLAELYYAKGELDQARDYLNRVQSSDLFYTLDTKLMQCKIYYEIKAIEVLISLIASFKIYIKRHKDINEGNKKAYLNFLYFLNKLIKFKELDKVTLKKEIDNTQILTARSWLLKIITTI